MRELMTLGELATGAGITRQTAAKRVKALNLGIKPPGRARLMFDRCDLWHLRAGQAMMSEDDLKRIMEFGKSEALAVFLQAIGPAPIKTENK